MEERVKLERDEGAHEGVEGGSWQIEEVGADGSDVEEELRLGMAAEGGPEARFSLSFFDLPLFLESVPLFGFTGSPVVFEGD